MKICASILSTGSEVLEGRVTDTNSVFLLERLAELGLPVEHVLSCADEMGSILQSLNFLAARSLIIIVSGGLGPTADDLTREAVAEFAGLELELNESLAQQLEKLYQAKGRVFDEVNKKQAYVPKGAVVIPNRLGTAPGFSCAVKGADGITRHVIALSGVPFELKSMFDEAVLPFIIKEILPPAGGFGFEKRSLRVFGLPESTVAKRIQESSLPPEVIVSYRAVFPAVDVVLKVPRGPSAAEVIQHSLECVEEAVGRDYIFADDVNRPFEGVLHDLLLEKRLTIAVAESCTGGLVGALLTNMPGSSAYFVGGVVSYSNHIKTKLLGVAETVLQEHGAVSFETAELMAQGVRNSFSSDLGLAVTGIAGPEGGSAEKPVGTFFIGFCDKNESIAYKCFFSSTRERIRKYSAYAALDVVRRKLLRRPIVFPGNH